MVMGSYRFLLAVGSVLTAPKDSTSKTTGHKSVLGDMACQERSRHGTETRLEHKENWIPKFNLSNGEALSTCLIETWEDFHNSNIYLHVIRVKV